MVMVSAGAVGELVGGRDVLAGRLLLGLEFEGEEAVGLPVVCIAVCLLGLGFEVAERRMDTSEDCHITIMPFA
jgi:hypothetical protein